ncbi:hypothetical protein HanIR_Chr10g0472061 [Helianthus annuus]|nr:hypothetical protein HanIR_Chr10g0472061 [Helianthus annuus]
MTGNRPVALVVLLVFAREGEVGTRCGVKVWIEREREREWIMVER